MDKNDYVKTVIVNGYTVDIGLDDYGQQYYFTYYDQNGELQERCCGSYQTDYMEQIYYELDPEFKKLVKKSLWGELTPEEEELYNNYLLKNCVDN